MLPSFLKVFLLSDHYGLQNFAYSEFFHRLVFLQFLLLHCTIQMSIAAVARRRKLLNDDVIISLADGTWEVLDISGSDVSDFGLAKVAEMCGYLRAVNIRLSNYLLIGIG